MDHWKKQSWQLQTILAWRRRQCPFSCHLSGRIISLLVSAVASLVTRPQHPMEATQQCLDVFVDWGWGEFFFPKQVYLWGSLLEKNRLDTLLGALGLVGRGFGPAGRAGLGWAWGLAVLGALAGLGVVLGVLWVGRGVWLCWARWLGWAWGLAVLGALAGLGVVLGVLGVLAGLGVVLGVGFGRAGRAGWVGRGVGRGVWAR